MGIEAYKTGTDDGLKLQPWFKGPCKRKLAECRRASRQGFNTKNPAIRLQKMREARKLQSEFNKLVKVTCEKYWNNLNSLKSVSNYNDIRSTHQMKSAYYRKLTS